MSSPSTSVTVATPSTPGRRTYKKKATQRKDGIWPPVLERALVQALEKYRPPSYLRDTRLLRRFPKRNQYISDYIFATTGTRRTAKQVSSRLQQLRDTCKDTRVLNLISRREYTPEGDTPSDFSLSTIGLESASTASSPISPASDFVVSTPESFVFPSPSTTPPRTFVAIQLVAPSSFCQPSCIRSFPPRADYSRHNQRFISLEYPSDMDKQYPLLTYITPRKIPTSSHYSHFRVLVGGVVVHLELTKLAFVSSSLVGTQHTYSTLLIPGFWGQLCRTADLSQCIIEQDILRTHVSFDAVPASPLPTDRSIRAVTYSFSVSCAATEAPPVFHSPALQAEPPLPPEFPNSLGHSSCSRTAYHDSQAMVPRTPIVEYVPPGPYYAPTVAETDPSYAPAYVRWPLASESPDVFYSSNSNIPHSSSFNTDPPGVFWPSGECEYDEYDTTGSFDNSFFYGSQSSAWYDAPMYSELQLMNNVNSF